MCPKPQAFCIKGGFPRVKSYDGFYHAQKAIYATQKELEQLRLKTHPDSLIVCDRGSLDALAYWPDTPESFFKNISSNDQFIKSIVYGKQQHGFG